MGNPTLMSTINTAASSELSVLSFLDFSKIELLQKWYGKDTFSVIRKIGLLARSRFKRYSVIDFDDTLNNRARQLQHPLLQDNRGDAGTFVAIELFGKRLKNAFHMYFGDSAMSKELSELLLRTPASILTATAAPGFQREKMNECFPHVDKILTQKGIDKPKAIIDKIIRLGEVPKYVDIYDDRTNNFYGVQDSKRADNDMLLVSSLFPGTIFKLYYVEYAGRESEPMILQDRIWQDGKCTYARSYAAKPINNLVQEVNHLVLHAS